MVEERKMKKHKILDKESFLKTLKMKVCKIWKGVKNEDKQVWYLCKQQKLISINDDENWA